jgi:hypothetical protein
MEHLMNHQEKKLFLQQVGQVFDVPSLRGLADAVATLGNPEISRSLMVACNQLSPFFVPSKPATPDAASMPLWQWLSHVSDARAAAANARTPRIIVSAPMKSGSTFISDSIGKAFNLPKVSMMMLLARPYDYAPFGAGNRPHEIDEMALIAACLNGIGFVSHHHMLCSPFLAKQAELYNLKFVLLKRNIFDCILSLDDFCFKNISQMKDPAAAYIRTQLPTGFVAMEQEERIHHLLNRFLGVYVHYHVSWKFFAARGLIQPFWISYEDELLVDKEGLTARLCEWLGRPESDTTLLFEQLARDKDLGGVNFNKGVAGRGAVIQGANRQRVVDAFNAFKDIADWSEILD